MLVRSNTYKELYKVSKYMGFFLILFAECKFVAVHLYIVV